MALENHTSVILNLIKAAFFIYRIEQTSRSMLWWWWWFFLPVLFFIFFVAAEPDETKSQQYNVVFMKQLKGDKHLHPHLFVS